MPLKEEAIKRDIVDQLTWDDRVDASRIAVTVDDGSVILTGSVPTPYAREAATKDAKSVPGVATVENQLTVEIVEPGPSDAELEERMRKVLEWNPTFDADRITVSSRNGIVTLTGSVDAAWKKFEAEDRLLDLAGVVDIINELTVVPSKSTTDELIADDIRATIDRRADVNIEDIDIEVDSGVVTLSGAVPTWSARHAAMEAARYTLGVTAVHDEVVVMSP